MKSSVIVSIFTMAMAALAAPAEADADLVARTGSSQCNNDQKQVCCNGAGLICLVQVLSDTCTGGSYCCESDAPVGTLINIQALNCVKIL